MNPETVEGGAVLPLEEARAETAQKPLLGGAGGALLVMAVLAAAGWVFGHWQGDSFFSSHLPGIGLTLTQVLLMAAALICAGKKGTLRWSAGGVFCLILSLLVGLSFALFMNDGLRAMNLPVAVLLSAQAVFSLTGQLAHAPLSAAGLWDGLRLVFRVPMRHWAVPFRSLSIRNKQKQWLYPLLLGMVLAIPVAAVAASLLASADALFASFLQSSALRLSRFDGSFLVRLILTLFLSLLIFSFLFSALLPPKELPGAPSARIQPVAATVVLLTLALLYALFAYIQVRYLFGGVSSVHMSGGYAAYARSGFFQLVALAFLTLALILPVLSLCKDSKFVRFLCALVSALTIVIDFSAFFRMRLYMDAYGLSTLRILTLWAMGVILLALGAVLVKSAKPALRICPLLATAVLISWAALNLGNIDRMVGINQVRRYNEGLSEWSAVLSLRDSCTPDYLPALHQIENEEKRAEALEDFTSLLRADAETLLPYDWSFCQTLLPNEGIH